VPEISPNAARFDAPRHQGGGHFTSNIAEMRKGLHTHVKLMIQPWILAQPNETNPHSHFALFGASTSLVLRRKTRTHAMFKVTAILFAAVIAAGATMGATVRSSEKIGCAKYEYYCAQSKACLPAWACCGCDSADAAAPVELGCAKYEFYCAQSKACLPMWACCGCNTVGLADTPGIIAAKREYASHKCAASTFWCPAAQECRSPAVTCEAAGVKPYRCPHWACCTCDVISLADTPRVIAAKREYTSHKCAASTFWCPAAQECRGADASC
jgi:hypothetical protein